MSRVTGKLTVFFENPFWVGIFERLENGKLSAAKITFGAQPREQEVHDFILKHYWELQFSPAISAVNRETKKNPKRIQRDIKKQLSSIGTGTKSQQALQLQHEQYKQERKTKTRELKEAEARRQYELKLQKKKEKHKGR